MILFTNLEDVKIDGKKYNPIPILKLTTGEGFELNRLNKQQKKILNLLKKEAQINKFKILLNNSFMV